MASKRLHIIALKRTKVILLIAAFVFGAFKPGVEEDQGNEYQLKAMFVFNFIKYVEWPDANTHAEFTIGVIGESEITGPLERISLQKKVGDKKIVVRKLSAEEDTHCDIILVSRSRANKLELLEKKYEGKGVLIISDESPRPAAINLITKQSKVRFEINTAVAKNCGVKISSQLLSLALAVY